MVVWSKPQPSTATVALPPFLITSWFRPGLGDITSVVSLPLEQFVQDDVLIESVRVVRSREPSVAETP